MTVNLVTLGSLTRAIVKAALRLLGRLKGEGTTRGVPQSMATFGDANEIFGHAQIEEREGEFLPTTAIAAVETVIPRSEVQQTDEPFRV